MKIILEEKDFNYIYSILMSLPIRELEKVQEVLKALESKKDHEKQVVEES
jgi:hypothetical protein